MRQATQPRRFRQRVGHQIVDGHRRIHQPVDERRIGAVLQQASDQVGEQGLLRADRRIDAAGFVEPVLPDDLVVQCLAHPMETLEFVVAVSSEMIDGRQGIGVVGGKLREDCVGCRQQRLRAREVASVGIDLAREHRVPGLPVYLRALDLGVPVRPLDQADHQPVTAAPREVDQVVDHEPAALLVALDHEADAVPAGQGRVEGQRFQQIQRDVQPIAFFGIDADADVVVPR